VTGRNYPPMHPNCRSTTVVYFGDEDDDPGVRIARGADGKTYEVPGDMSYAEWKRQYGDGKGVEKDENHGIINKTGVVMNTDENINSPIEQRNTAKGNPNAILQAGRPLNNRQQRLLEALPSYDSRAYISKRNVSMRDLAALTALTGDEFAMFTKGNQRLIVRGDAFKVNITSAAAKALHAQGYRWSGHTHPGTDGFSLLASDGDKAILQMFGQTASVIYNAKGIFEIFFKE